MRINCIAGNGTIFICFNKLQPAKFNTLALFIVLLLKYQSLKGAVSE